jgi:hypothetical protein
VGNYCTGAQFFCKSIDDSALDESQKITKQNQYPPSQKKRERTYLFLEQYCTVYVIADAYFVVDFTACAGRSTEVRIFLAVLNKPQFCILDGKIYRYTVCAGKYSLGSRFYFTYEIVCHKNLQRKLTGLYHVYRLLPI